MVKPIFVNPNYFLKEVKLNSVEIESSLWHHVVWKFILRKSPPHPSVKATPKIVRKCWHLAPTLHYKFIKLLHIIYFSDVTDLKATAE